ncbi:hypothetical protein ACA910_004465 [Epithemia clementina (nom. ined.)]
MTAPNLSVLLSLSPSSSSSSTSTSWRSPSTPDDNDDDDTTTDHSSSRGGRYTWVFPNGSVVLEDPLRISGTLVLTQPELLGSGGGGAVFAMTPRMDPNSSSSSSDSGHVALKVSWTSSAASVQNECHMWRRIHNNCPTMDDEETLANHETSNGVVVEQCLARQPYPYDPRHQRTMIVLTPVLEQEPATTTPTDTSSLSFTSVSPVSHLDLVTDSLAHSVALHGIVQAMMHLLSANVVTTDVQFLMSPTTGRVLLIDLTEAKAIGVLDKSQQRLSDTDVILAKACVLWP